MTGREPSTYEQAGVSVSEGRRFVDLIAGAVKSTHNEKVLKDAGGFAGIEAFGDDTPVAFLVISVV